MSERSNFELTTVKHSIFTHSSWLVHVFSHHHLYSQPKTASCYLLQICCSVFPLLPIKSQQIFGSAGSSIRPEEHILNNQGTELNLKPHKWLVNMLFQGIKLLFVYAVHLLAEVSLKSTKSFIYLLQMDNIFLCLLPYYSSLR